MIQKRLLAMILTISVAVTMILTGRKNESAVAAEMFAITSPRENALIGAGHFEIQWLAATSSTVREYQVYVDDELIGTTTDTSYEYYTTNVKMYSAYVKAEYINGNSQSTEKVKFGVTKKGICIDSNMGKYLNPVITDQTSIKLEIVLSETTVPIKLEQQK